MHSIREKKRKELHLLKPMKGTLCKMVLTRRLNLQNDSDRESLCSYILQFRLKSFRLKRLPLIIETYSLYIRAMIH